jgi:hypothetical protein
MRTFNVSGTVVHFPDSGGALTWTVPTEPPLPAQITFAGREILDANGVRIVPRGPELIVASTDAIGDIDEMADMGANAVRLLLGLDTINGMTPTIFRQVLDRIVARDMVAWVSLYTWNGAANREIAPVFGGGNFESLTAPPGTGVCSTATPGPCYLSMWDRQWLKDLMNDYRENVIIDASQEFIDPSDPETPAGRLAWRNEAINHIQFFRAAGYTQPLAIMSNYEGRDLYAITEHAAAIMAADTVMVNGQAQIIFGWQAYWSPEWAQSFYPDYQGNLFLGVGQSLTSVQAINTILPTLNYPVQAGFDNYVGDSTAPADDYDNQLDAAAAQLVPWLWWAWAGNTVEAPYAFSTGGAPAQAAVRAYVEDSPAGFAGARTALGGGAGTPVGGMTRDVYAYLNSLHNHDAGAGNANTSTGNWLRRMALQAPNGGNTYTLGSLFGFANAWETPPRGGGQEEVPSPYITGTNSWANAGQIEVVGFVPDNFEAPNHDPLDANGTMGFAYQPRLLELIDAWQTNAPNASRRYVVYAGWPDMGPYGDPATISAGQITAYRTWALGGYQTWMELLVSRLQAARPALDIRLHDVSRALMLTWRDTVVSTIPAGTLFEDDSPHGRSTWYFLAAVAEYIELFNEKPPANFAFQGGWNVHATVTSNYQAIVDFMWGVLRP